MFAIIETGGKQHRTTTGDIIRVDLIKNVKEGDRVTFDRVVFLEADTPMVGQPYVPGAQVEAVVTHMGPDGKGVKGTKILAFKMRRRKGFHKTIGYRHRYTELRIEKIVI